MKRKSHRFSRIFSVCFGTSAKTEKLNATFSKLRLESLEERQMLSVTPTQYQEIRSLYPELELPEIQGNTNIIEVVSLTAADLQNAVHEAAQTVESDVILVKTSSDQRTISLQNTLEISIDSNQFGDLKIFAPQDSPLNIPVSNSDDSSILVREGNLTLQNINFVDVDMSDINNYVNILAVSEENASYHPINISIFDSAGNDVSNIDAKSILEEERNAELYTYAENAYGTNASLNISSTAASSSNYAILFYGGVKKESNYQRYYENLKDLYSVLSVGHNIPKANIYILYAGGVNSSTYISTTEDQYLQYPYEATPQYVKSNLSFAKGSPVYSATASNLNSVCTTVAGKMGSSDHLLFFSYDHGSGFTNKDYYSAGYSQDLCKTDTNDYLCGWGEKIKGQDVAQSLFKIKKGYITTVHSQCFSGGILDDIQNPSTGAVLDTSSSATWYGMAATNHYESSITSIEANPSTGVFLSAEGFAQSFTDAIRPTGQNLNNTVQAFNFSNINDPFSINNANHSSSSEYNNNYYKNAGKYQYDLYNNQWSFTVVEHPWAVGPSFNIFATSTTSYEDDTYDPNDTYSTAYNLGTISSTRTVSNLKITPNSKEDWFKFTLASAGTSDSSISINYTHANGVDLDMKLYNASSSSTYIGSSLGISGTETISLSGLAAGTYYIKIYQYSGSSLSDSATYTLTITPPAKTLSAPTISASVKTATSVNVSISRVTNATGYQLQYSTSSSFATYSVKNYVNPGTQTVTNLISGKTYYFRVKATSATQTSAWSNTANAKLPVQLSTPTLSVRAKTSTSASVTIGSVANATGYQLQYSTSSTFATYSVKNYKNPGIQTVTNLASGKTYYFRVKAVGNADDIIDSDWTAQRTLAPTAASLDAAFETNNEVFLAEDADEPQIFIEQNTTKDDVKLYDQVFDEEKSSLFDSLF